LGENIVISCDVLLFVWMPPSEFGELSGKRFYDFDFILLVFSKNCFFGCYEVLRSFSCSSPESSARLFPSSAKILA